MTSKNNKVLKQDHREDKRYAYTLGNVSFNVTLRSDIKEDMKNFLKILEQAKKDIADQLAKLK